MPAFFEFLRNITYYLLFASLVSMVAPAGKYRQYVKLITGFILLFLLIRPLEIFLDGPGSLVIPVTDLFAAAYSAPVSELDYTYLHDITLQTAFEEQLRIQLDALLGQKGYELVQAEFMYPPDYSLIESMAVTVRSKQKESEKRPFIRIEPIRIGNGEAEQPEAAVSEIKNLIAGFYRLPAEHIYVKIQ